MIYNEGHAEHMNDLQTSDGWKILSAWLHSRIDYHKNQLITCKIEEVEAHRAQIKAYTGTLQQPQRIIDEVAESVAERS